jgi:hypothetical protein
VTTHSGQRQTAEGVLVDVDTEQAGEKLVINANMKELRFSTVDGKERWMSQDVHYGGLLYVAGSRPSDRIVSVIHRVVVPCRIGGNRLARQPVDVGSRVAKSICIRGFVSCCIASASSPAAPLD